MSENIHGHGPDVVRGYEPSSLEEGVGPGGFCQVDGSSRGCPVCNEVGEVGQAMGTGVPGGQDQIDDVLFRLLGHMHFAYLSDRTASDQLDGAMIVVAGMHLRADLRGHVSVRSQFGDHPGVAGRLAETLREDRFWAVRVAAVETLASLEGPESETELRAATSDERSEVRRAAIRALGGAEDATLVPFFRERFLSDSSYLVQAEALRAIGRSGDEDQIDFLRQASQVDSPRDVIRAAAEWAIEEIEELGG